MVLNMRNKNLFNCKRGTIDEFLFWILRIIMLLMFIASLVGVINYVTNSALETYEFEYKALVERSVNCLSYYDFDTFRRMSGVLDPVLLNDEVLGDCIASNSELYGIGIKFNLKDESAFHLNKEFYEEYKPIAWSKTYGTILEKKYVLIRQIDGKLIPDVLEIDAVIRKI